jgi:hypothetical protein
MDIPLRPIITITPVYKIEELVFAATVNSIAANQTSSDFWVVCIDKNSELLPSHLMEIITTISDKIKFTILKSTYQQGGGNTRNFALDWYQSNKNRNFRINNFILTFLDSDDYYEDNFFQLIRTHYKGHEGVVTFSYKKKLDFKISYKIFPDDFLSYRRFLLNYCSSCLSTAILVKDNDFFKKHRFGIRYRANDQLFFLNVVQTFGGLYRRKASIAVYNIGNNTSISSKKIKMPFYKALALRDHGLNYLMIGLCMFFYAIYGVKSHGWQLFNNFCKNIKYNR